MRPLVAGGVGFGGTCRVAFMLRNLANFQKMKLTPDAVVFASLINNNNQEASVVSATLSLAGCLFLLCKEIKEEKNDQAQSMTPPLSISQ